MSTLFSPESTRSQELIIEQQPAIKTILKLEVSDSQIQIQKSQKVEKARSSKHVQTNEHRPGLTFRRMTGWFWSGRSLNAVVILDGR